MGPHVVPSWEDTCRVDTTWPTMTTTHSTSCNGYIEQLCGGMGTELDIVQAYTSTLSSGMSNQGQTAMWHHVFSNLRVFCKTWTLNHEAGWYHHLGTLIMFKARATGGWVFMGPLLFSPSNHVQSMAMCICVCRDNTSLMSVCLAASVYVVLVTGEHSGLPRP